MLWQMGRVTAFEGLFRSLRSCLIPTRPRSRLFAPCVGTAAIGTTETWPRRQRPYPSDLSDARWELLEPTLTAWRVERRGKGLDIGRPPEHDLRRIMDAILYVDRTGIPWRYLPRDFAPWETVYGYFAAWQKDGVFDQLNGLLRRLVRKAGGRDAEPSACILGAQSIKTSANVPAAGQGIDAGKKIAGRKRHIGVDTVGLLLAVLVTAASVSDNVGGIRLLSNIAEGHPRVTKAWADSWLPHQGHRPRRPPGHRRRSHPPRPRPEGFQGDSATLGRRADLRLAHAPPPPRPRLRNQPTPLRSHDQHSDDRPHHSR